MNFYISDLHIGHENVIKYDNRPFINLEEMHSKILENWNSVVGNNDNVYILGDFSFSKQLFIEYANKMKGIKHFIIGNHDPEHMDRKLLNKSYFHGYIHKIKDNGRKVVLCHFPIREWDGFFKGVVHFHGHTHGTIGKSFIENAYDVGAVLHNYTPVKFDDIVSDILYRNPRNSINICK